MQTTQRPGLELMLLGNFETAGFAGSKRHLRSSCASPPSWPEIAEFGTAKNVCNRAITSKCR
ncbi:hypothetical protein FGZ69_06310 [Lacticaseibacillus paracasei]|uniref:Uncharacterized protein n=1 Tax=Lacticaseibacillus paracasei TaxID=1597 RepID=A0AB38Q738_LACPA|nr:hypothetical protein [Lacticaseibacillus paracasei]MCT3319488.1 hypothetical protein [Lacticaseibacillus paracasei]MCT3374065.1 hypothetical protein [Lacticaseibacillus paracasei]PLC47053.1 hypothetical protein C0Q90_03820 [Lacticaseibacillus paracasei]QDP36520.1 hypothetical protein FGZ69_06310 [Lacticaseibacillus paracasei]